MQGVVHIWHKLPLEVTEWRDGNCFVSPSNEALRNDGDFASYQGQSRGSHVVDGA